MLEKDKYGVWIGENSVIALTEKLQISFLRLRKDNIVSIIKHIDKGIIGVVYGYGESNKESHCDVAFNNKSNLHLMDLHLNDKLIFNNEKLIYKMYDGTEFINILAEKIIISNIDLPIQNSNLSVAQKLELWNLGTYFDCDNEAVCAGIDAHQYSICYNLSFDGKMIYCRVGQNGYCEKGRAMLSTICLRPNEVRMIDNNLESLNEYKPMLECFIPDSCAFPSDYGWYWSLKEVNDDFVTLHGCGGDIYKVSRINKNRYETFS